MNNTQILGRVRFEIRKFILNSMDKRAKHTKVIFYSSNKKLKNGHNRGISFWVDPNIINKAFDYLTQIPKFRYRFNEEDFSKILTNDLGASYVSFKARNVDDVVNDIMSQIEHQCFEWLCVIPLYGIIICHKIDLHGICLYPYDKRHEVLSHCRYNTLSNELNNKLSFATLTIKTGAPNIAIQLSTLIIYSITNAFTVAFSTYQNIYNIKPGNHSYPRRGNEILVVSSKNTVLSPKQYFSSIWLILNSKKVHNNSFLMKYVKEISLIQNKRINDIENVSELEIRFNNASNLIAEGIRSQLNSTKIIKFMSAMEAMVEDRRLKVWGTNKYGERKKHQVGIARQISHKIPKILSNIKYSGDYMSNTKLSHMKRDLHHLYKLRSHMAHGSIIWVNDNDVKKLWSISQLSLFIILDEYVLRGKDQSDVNSDLNKIFK